MMATTPMTVPQKTDDAQLADWIETQQLWLWRYLRFLGAAADVAEDLCQETLLAALHHDIRSREPNTAIAWLRTTARNFFRKQLRGRRKREALQLMLARDAQLPTPALLRAASGEDASEALRACLETLSPPMREALERRYQDNASRREMAAAMRRPEEAIKTMLRRAKEHLRDCIERRRTP